MVDDAASIGTAEKIGRAFGIGELAFNVSRNRAAADETADV